MINTASAMPVAVGRSSDGKALFECRCPDCNELGVRIKRYIGNRCHPCAMRRRRIRNFSDCSIVARTKGGEALFNSECPDCSEVRIVTARGRGKLCLPCSMARRATHGLVGTKLYVVWAGIKGRCSTPTASNYQYYGGRGIAVCKDWLNSPEAFIKWAEENGYQDGLELDRIDINGDYSPRNCRFISHMENSQLRRNARCTLEQAREVKALLAQGKKIREVQDIVGIPYMSVWHISKRKTWRNT